MKYVILLCCLVGSARADIGDCFELDGSLLAPGKTHATNRDGTESKYECTAQDRAFFDGIAQAKLERQQNAELVARAQAQADASHRTNLAFQAAQAHEADQVNRGLSSLADGLQSIAATKQQTAENQARTADEIGRMTAQADAERAAERARQQRAEAQRVEERARAPTQPPPSAQSVPAKHDPLAPTPSPSQTVESRRAAGLPDDPNAAACIQDDECRRAVLHENVPKN